MNHAIRRNMIRAWKHRTTTQVATMTALTATFTVLAVMLTISMNVRKVITHWGNSVHLTAYVEDQVDHEQQGILKQALEKLGHFKEVDFQSKQEALNDFRKEMESFDPEIFQSEELGNPLPASFKLSLKAELGEHLRQGTLATVVSQISNLTGIEEVAYGQRWIQNYTHFLKALGKVGMGLLFTLLLGAVLVIGNSLRSALADRREEIEILELVGATPSMIRWPFLVEGAMMGLVTGALSLAVAGVLYTLGTEVIRSNLSFTALMSHVHFLPAHWMFLFLLTTSALGFLGSYVTVRKINTGWASAGDMN